MRKDVAFASHEFELSERRACKLIGMDRGSYRYEPRPDRNGTTARSLAVAGPAEAALRIPAVACAAGTARPSGQRDAHLPAVSSRRTGGSAAEEEAAIACSCGNACGSIEPGVGARFRLRHSGDGSRHSCSSSGGCLYERKPFLRSRHQLIEPSRDAGARRRHRASRKAGSDSLRQRPGTDQPALLELVRRTEDPTDPHSARTTDAERPRGEFQRTIARRVLKRKLVSQSTGRAGEDQRVAR